MLKKNIILPDYQRHFVWDEGHVAKLVETFQNNEFVPPVTIGAFKEVDSTQNIVLDGQQRLTSILLAYLELFPDRDRYKKDIERFASEDDEPGEEDELENVIEWTFHNLVGKGNNKESIQKAVEQGHYYSLTLAVDDAFLKSKFLGFSYLVPNVTDKRVQQRFYSTVFRNINIQGKPLIPQDSRKSFYFLDDTMSTFFDPSFAQNFSVKISSQTAKLDFVRYLAILSQYTKDGDSSTIARGYKSKMEEYYVQYIHSVVGEKESPIFIDFKEAFPVGEYKHRFDRLVLTLSDLEIPHEFPSIIDLDMNFFGLIYWIVFEDKTMYDSSKGQIREELKSKIEAFRTNTHHTKSPGALKYLKERIDASIAVYKKHIHDN
jgi:hypothetical protein